MKPNKDGERSKLSTLWGHMPWDYRHTTREKREQKPGNLENLGKLISNSEKIYQIFGKIIRNYPGNEIQNEIKAISFRENSKSLHPVKNRASKVKI